MIFAAVPPGVLLVIVIAAAVLKPLSFEGDAAVTMPAAFVVPIVVPLWACAFHREIRPGLKACMMLGHAVIWWVGVYGAMRLDVLTAGGHQVSSAFLLVFGTSAMVLTAAGLGLYAGARAWLEGRRRCR